MVDPPSISQLLDEDPRYPLEAYIFVFEALNYGSALGMGKQCPSEPIEPPPTRSEEEEEAEIGQRHVTGQELCEAVRRFALEQYGYMAKTVLANWGIHATADLGELVFNLIRIRQMRRRPTTAARISTTSTILRRRSSRTSVLCRPIPRPHQLETGELFGDCPDFRSTKMGPGTQWVPSHTL